MPDIKKDHVHPFKFSVGEKVWVPGLSDIAKVKERGRQYDCGLFKTHRYLVAASGRECWREEEDLCGLSEGGLERAVDQAMTRAYLDNESALDPG